jgi:plasmid stabilization system protein ParE
MKAVRFTGPAVRDAARAAALFARDYYCVSREFLSALGDSCAALAHDPALGAPRDDCGPGIRAAAQGAYLVFYQATASEIIVLRVLAA